MQDPRRLAEQVLISLHFLLAMLRGPDRVTLGPELRATTPQRVGPAALRLAEEASLS